MRRSCSGYSYQPSSDHVLRHSSNQLLGPVDGTWLCHMRSVHIPAVLITDRDLLVFFVNSADIVRFMLAFATSCRSDMICLMKPYKLRVLFSATNLSLLRRSNIMGSPAVQPPWRSSECREPIFEAEFSHLSS